jgi:hypothetical protein
VPVSDIHDIAIYNKWVRSAFWYIMSMQRATSTYTEASDRMDVLKGLIADDSVKQEVLGRFMESFVKSDYTGRDPVDGGRRLMWCSITKEFRVYLTEELFQVLTGTDRPVYFYNERTEEMHLTGFEDVRAFINSFEPWDEVDAEVFDDSLEWVIAVTHEDTSLVIGLDVPIEEFDYDKWIATP